MKEIFEKYPPIPHDFNLFNRGRVEIIKQAFRDFPTIFNAFTGNMKRVFTYLS